MSFKNDGSDSLTVFMHLESVIKYEQEIIEELKSELGNGTTFTVQIPLKTSETDVTFHAAS